MFYNIFWRQNLKFARNEHRHPPQPEQVGVQPLSNMRESDYTQIHDQPAHITMRTYVKMDIRIYNNKGRQNRTANMTQPHGDSSAL